MQIGFRKKIKGLPRDINKERTNAPSMIGLRTKPMMRGLVHTQIFSLRTQPLQK